MASKVKKSKTPSRTKFIRVRSYSKSNWLQFIKKPSRLLIAVLAFAVVGAGALYVSHAAVPANQLDSTAETDQYNRVNGLRASLGEPRLVRSQCLTNWAREWAEEMALSNNFRHSNMESLYNKFCVGVAVTYLEENIAQAPEATDSVTASSQIFTGFTNSPDHYANMTSRKVRYMGVGVFDDANGGMWLVQAYSDCVSNCSSPTIAGAPTSVGALPLPMISADSGGTGSLWGVTKGGDVYLRGAAYEGDLRGSNVTNVVGLAVKSSRDGYWLATSNGAVYHYGTAGNYGSMAGKPLAKPIVGMAATPSGNGYWLVASDGGIFSFGAAKFHGSTGAIKLNKPIVGMVSTKTGNGYWLVASDGGIFSFGDAHFYGSTGGMKLTLPITAMARTASGNGYWLLGLDGGIFSFGDAKYYGSGSGKLSGEFAIALTRAPDGKGYWMTTTKGRILHFGSAAAYANWPQPLL